MNITSFTFSFVVSTANVDSHAPVKIKKNNYQTISWFSASLLTASGNSNSIALQYFSIAQPQSIAISITKFQSIAILITKQIKYCKNYSNTFKVLQKVLHNFSSIVKSIAKFQKYCKKHYKISKYYKKYRKISHCGICLSCALFYWILIGNNYLYIIYLSLI